MSEQQKMSFEEILEQWTKAYAFCSVFEIQYILGQVGKEEYQDFLNDKARLIASVPQVLLTKCMTDKDNFDKKYINELYGHFLGQLEKDKIELTDFDKKYIDNMIDNLEDDLKNGVYTKKDSNKDE